MSACPDRGRLAAAASGQDDDAADHAAACARCRPIVAELAGTAALLGVLPAPTLPAARREAIGNGLLVAVDRGVAAPRRVPWAAIGIGVAMAAAAGILIAIAAVRSPTPKPRPPQAAAPEPVAPPAPAVQSAPAPERAVVKREPRIEVIGRAVREVDGDVVKLREGAIAVDTRSATPLAVSVGSATIAVNDARVEVRARKGVLTTVRVFAGSVEVDNGGQRTEVVAGELWRSPSEPVLPPPPTAPTAAEWFRRGWVAMREERYEDAAEAFDKANDPSVAEDAAFWSAVARERAGDHTNARTRFERFLSMFPGSIRADAARQHLEALPR